MNGVAQHAQLLTGRAECAQSCARLTLQLAETHHVAAQIALVGAVDPVPCAQEVVFTKHRSRPCQHRLVSTCVWPMPYRLRFVRTHRRSEDQELARRRSKLTNDGRHEHRSRETGLCPVPSEREAWRLLLGSVAVAGGPSGCTGQRTRVGCLGARAVVLMLSCCGIRPRLAPRRRGLVHSLLSMEQPQPEAILRTSWTNSTDDGCLKSAASLQSYVRPWTAGTEVAFIDRPAQRIDTMKSLPSILATPKSPSSTESGSTSKDCTSARFSSSSKSPPRSRTGRSVNAGLLAGEGMDPGSILVPK